MAAFTKSDSGGSLGVARENWAGRDERCGWCLIGIAADADSIEKSFLAAFMLKRRAFRDAPATVRCWLAVIWRVWVVGWLVVVVMVVLVVLGTTVDRCRLRERTNPSGLETRLPMWWVFSVVIVRLVVVNWSFVVCCLLSMVGLSWNTRALRLRVIGSAVTIVDDVDPRVRLRFRFGGSGDVLDFELTSSRSSTINAGLGGNRDLERPRRLYSSLADRWFCSTMPGDALRSAVLNDVAGWLCCVTTGSKSLPVKSWLANFVEPRLCWACLRQKKKTNKKCKHKNLLWRPFACW